MKTIRRLVNIISAALFAVWCAPLSAQPEPVLPAPPPITPSAHLELFNGKNFDGWTFCMTNNADPMKTWIVTNGVIHCTGSPIGYIRSLKTYRNFYVTVEWRYLKVAPRADNSGVLVHMQPPDAVWPMCIQNQGKSGHQGDLFLMMGAESKEHKGMDKNLPVPMHGPSNEHPVGNWDTNVTACATNDVQAFINGKFMNETTQCTISSGFVGIQSEGGDIEIRRISLDPLPYPGRP
jgi:hypothetical protein